jgi:8-oxo-dGTP pyrophosphatase MutT (NUDIX family)
MTRDNFVPRSTGRGARRAPEFASIAALETYLKAAIAVRLPGPAVQRRFAPVPVRNDWAPDARPDTARHAAALVLVHPGPEGPSIPLTVRHADLPHHAGQVSLPGGALDPGERADAAALREAHEEIGVPSDDVRIVGALSTVWIGVSNFLVHPYVAVTDVTPGFRAHPGEVATLFDVTIAALCDPRSLKWARREREALQMIYPYFDIRSHVVWGATAMILGEFACLFDPDFGPGQPPDWADQTIAATATHVRDA